MKTRDAVIVYPKGPGSKAVEVPLIKTKNGYMGDKVIIWDDLGKLTDEGTKIDVAIFDHDKSSGQDSEELHRIRRHQRRKELREGLRRDAGHDGDREGPGEGPLGRPAPGAPIGGSIVTACGLPSSANADICATLKDSKALGVTVAVTPPNNKVAACIDKTVRRLHYPMSHRPNKIHKKF